MGYEIRNNTGLHISFNDIGASINFIRLNGTLLTVQPKSEDVFNISGQYFGKTLGLIAGRLKRKIHLNGNTYILGNTNPEKEFILHGDGKNSLSFKKFILDCVCETDNHYTVCYKYEEKNMINIPGTSVIKVVYKISKNNNKISIYLNYLNNESQAPVNLSNHIYWSLGNKDPLTFTINCLANEIGVSNNELVLQSKEEIKYPFDFRKPTLINDVISDIEKTNTQTIDHTFVCSEKHDENIPLVTLENDSYKISCYTNYDATNIYLNNVPIIDELDGGNSTRKYNGLAIEPQKFLLNTKDLIVDKCQDDKHYITYVIETK